MSIARRYIQGRVSVHLSVTHRCCVETEEPVIIQSIQPAVPPRQVMDYYFLILSHQISWLNYNGSFYTGALNRRGKNYTHILSLPNILFSYSRIRYAIRHSYASEES